MQGNRVQRDIVEYASLSQSVVQLTKIVSEGMTHVKTRAGCSGHCHRSVAAGGGRFLKARVNRISRAKAIGRGSVGRLAAPFAPPAHAISSPREPG